MAYTWKQFVDGVISRLSDRVPDESAYAEALAEYVKARIAMRFGKGAEEYALHENRWTSLKRKLSGFGTSTNAAGRLTAVRDLIKDIAPDDEQFVMACYYYVKGHVVHDVNRNGQDSAAWTARYSELRLRLLGHTTTLNEADLKAAVLELVGTDGVGSTMDAWVSRMIKSARSDIEGFAAWLSSQIEAAAAEVSAMRSRIEDEIRNAVTLVQQYADTYCEGQVANITNADTVPNGYASLGQLPAGARPREVWVLYPDPEDADVTFRRVEACVVPWSENFELISRKTCTPLISIDRYGKTFLCTPQLSDGEIELEIKWDGVRTDFADDDVVTFDDKVMEVVALGVRSALAREENSRVTQSREFGGEFMSRLGDLLIEANERKGSFLPGETKSKPCCGGCSDTTATTTPLVGFELLDILNNPNAFQTGVLVAGAGSNAANGAYYFSYLPYPNLPTYVSDTGSIVNNYTGVGDTYLIVGSDILYRSTDVSDDPWDAEWLNTAPAVGDAPVPTFTQILGEHDVVFTNRLRSYQMQILMPVMRPEGYAMQLSSEGRIAGDEVSMLVQFTAGLETTRPTFKVFDKGSETELLSHLQDVMATEKWRADFTFNGTVWVKFGWVKVE